MLQKRPDRRLPSASRAAASPSAVVLAGAGVVVGEVAHLGLLVAVLLGAAGYGGRVAWAAAHRRLLLKRGSANRSSRVDPWSVPEPWRGYSVRAIEAKKAFLQLSKDCPPGPVADYLAANKVRVESAVQGQWALARSGAALSVPSGRLSKVAAELVSTQDELARATGADHGPLEVKEAALASQLRSLRDAESVGTEISSHLAGMVAQLEGVIASAARLVANAEASAPDLADLSSQLSSLNSALNEAKRIMPAGTASTDLG